MPELPWRDEQVIMRALSDPGAITPRDDRSPHHLESLTHWQMRALRIIFDAREDELAVHDRLRDNARRAARLAERERIIGWLREKADELQDYRWPVERAANLLDGDADGH